MPPATDASASPLVRFCLWLRAGPDGAGEFAASSWLFLRLLGLVSLIAFVSFWLQLNGLIGPHGILPAQPFLDAVQKQFGAARLWDWPTLCWLFGGGPVALHLLCAAGVLLSLLLIAGYAPALCLLLLWADYLSLSVAGQIFMNYQWDALLLETALLALLLAPWRWQTWRARAEPPRPARWLLWWLLFRLMFLSGAVKLASGDPVWRNLTALDYHYFTQPLPTWIAWYAHLLPAWFQKLSCGLMFVIELGAPFLLFGPRRLRHLGASLLIFLQVLIALTGNYTFFNLLSVALCLLCFDDACWRWLARRLTSPDASVRFAPRGLVRGAAGFVFVFTALQMLPAFFGRLAFPRPLVAVFSAAAPFRSLNTYGLFAVMTTQRPEIILEGSDNGYDWKPYDCRWKPGDPARRPAFVAPFQPRLDWQLWFAALESPQQNPWLLSLSQHLLEGTPAVLALFAGNPFPRHPPRYVRALLYSYTFTDAATRARTGRWWNRELLGYYLAPMSLNPS